MRSTTAPPATSSISRLTNSAGHLCPTFLHCPTVGKSPKRSTVTSGFRLGSGSPELGSAGDGSNLRFVLHDALDAAGIDTKQARAGREGFCKQVGRFTNISAEKSIAISGGADLARAALNIAAEDESLVSRSSAPLPVDAFLERLDDLSMGFCSLHLPPLHSPPEAFLRNLERYFYVHQGFRRTDMISDARSLYLHSVLTCRSGTAIMLSLIYSEMLKTLRICGFLDFDVEIYYPCDNLCLPSGYQKQKTCERLIILGTGLEELRDYAALLYHCGHYEDCFAYLNFYQNSRMSEPDGRDQYEEDAVKQLSARVNLILSERGWSKESVH